MKNKALWFAVAFCVLYLTGLGIFGYHMRADAKAKPEAPANFEHVTAFQATSNVWVDEVIVDGCEYLIFTPRGIHGIFVVHKSNCKNHRP